MDSSHIIPKKENTNINTIPNEVLKLIFADKTLGPADWAKISRVCKRWKQCMETNYNIGTRINELFFKIDAVQDNWWKAFKEFYNNTSVLVLFDHANPTKNSEIKKLTGEHLSKLLPFVKSIKFQQILKMASTIKDESDIKTALENIQPNLKYKSLSIDGVQSFPKENDKVIIVISDCILNRKGGGFSFLSFQNISSLTKTHFLFFKV